MKATYPKACVRCGVRGRKSSAIVQNNAVVGRQCFNRRDCDRRKAKREIPAT